MTVLKKMLLLFYRVIWYVQAIFLVLFWSFYFCAWGKLGHPPVASLNDPKNLGMDIFHGITWMMMLIAFYSFIFCCAVLLVKIVIRKIPLFKNDVLVFGVSAVLVILTFFSYQVEWFMD
jgi:hypothetical protein